MTGDQTSAAAPASEETTLLRVLSGHPNDEELAAVIGVVAALAARTSSTIPTETASAWARPAHVRQARPRSWAESRLPRWGG